MKLQMSSEWLLKMAELEANGIISAGGLISRMESILQSELPDSTKIKTGEAHVVDCSDWHEKEDQKWTSGQFVSKTKTKAKQVVSSSIPKLRLTVSHESKVEAKKLFELIVSIIHKLAEVVPELNLTYDQNESKVSSNQYGQPVVEIVLTPQTPQRDIDLQYSKLLSKLRDINKQLEQQEAKSTTELALI